MPNYALKPMTGAVEQTVESIRLFPQFPPWHDCFDSTGTCQYWKRVLSYYHKFCIFMCPSFLYRDRARQDASCPPFNLPWPQKRKEKNMAARFFSEVKLLLATYYPRKLSVALRQFMCSQSSEYVSSSGGKQCVSREDVTWSSTIRAISSTHRLKWEY